MAFFSWQKIVTGMTHRNIVYDAVSNSIWCAGYAASGDLVRIRATDGAYLDANAAVTDLAGATFAGGNGFAGASGIAGRKLYVGGQTTNLRRFDADTGAFEHQYVPLYYPASCWNAVTVNNICWFGVAVNGGSVADGIQGFDAAGNTAFWSGGGSGASPQYLATDGTYVYFTSASSGARTVWKIDPADGTVTSAVVMSATYGASQVVSVSCDGTYLWIGTGSDPYIWKVRCSDLEPIDANGDVCTAASDGNRFLLRNGTLYTTTCYASIYDGEVVWVAPGTVDLQFAVVDQATGYNGANLWGPGVTSSSAKNPILAAGYVWFPMNLKTDIWRIQSLAAPAAGVPNLTAVDPGTGPHISLTFDNPVGITGPTIGAASDGLGVTGVTAISATQIDLACAIRPDHPDGDASNATLAPPIGEADPLGPPVPTGVGATVI